MNGVQKSWISTQRRIDQWKSMHYDNSKWNSIRFTVHRSLHPIRQWICCHAIALMNLLVCKQPPFFSHSFAHSLRATHSSKEIKLANSLHTAMYFVWFIMIVESIVVKFVWVFFFSLLFPFMNCHLQWNCCVINAIFFHIRFGNIRYLIMINAV